MQELSLRERTLENVKVFWEMSHDAELNRLFPFQKNTLGEAIELFEESKKPGAKSFGRTICFGGRYIGDVWCYGIDEVVEKSAFVSIVIFDKAHWGMGLSKLALSRFCSLVFGSYALDRLCAFTYRENTRSVGMLRSIGFRNLGEFLEDGVASYYFELPRP
ncbi:MAG: GNAT family N-acetyltransferase [Clostridiaceae bacterium]|nr:GNAT family N-acetyltransferase [Eubacteriales bacterium]